MYKGSIKPVLISASYDLTIRFWDLIEMNVISIVNTSHTEKINCMELISDWNMVATGSSDKTLSLWSVKSHSLLKTFDLHTG
jgi:WD40 repeat protein